MRVFVLGTGRCGSLTFSKACAHITNYTSAHESNWGKPPPDRMNYPDDHIEVDNRLSWHLGEIDNRYSESFFVHLWRDPDAVAASFLRRWKFDPPFRYRRLPRRAWKIARRMESIGRQPSSIIEAYAYSILGRGRPWDDSERLSICRGYVDTVSQNIEGFLVDRHSMSFNIEAAAPGFGKFWELVHAEGDRDGAIREFEIRYNSS